MINRNILISQSRQVFNTEIPQIPHIVFEVIVNRKQRLVLEINSSKRAKR
jgi:hypothetical protein